MTPKDAEQILRHHYGHNPHADDLIQAGLVGYLEAMKRVDLSLPTAVAYIKRRMFGAVKDEFRRLDPLSRSARNAIKTDPADRTSKEDQLAAKVIEAHEQKFDSGIETAFASAMSTSALEELIETLPMRLRVVARHRVRGWKQEDIGDKLGVSAARVCQLERDAVEAMRNHPGKKCAKCGTLLTLSTIEHGHRYCGRCGWTPEVRSCTICGCRYRARRHDQVTCGGELCKKRNERVLAEKTQQSCSVCGVVFWHSRARKTCGDKECMTEYTRRSDRNRRRANLPDRTCVVCGNLFSPCHGRHSACSPECQRHAKNNLARRRRRERRR